MEPERIHDLTAAYALDALDSGEAEEFEEHLRHCERCRSDVAELQATAGSLAFAAPPAPLPVELRARILDQARAEQSNVIPFPARRSRLTWTLAAATAVAASAAIAFGVWAAILNDDLGAQRSALAIVAAPGTRHVGLSNGGGSLAVARNGQAVLLLSDLAQAPSGKTYEAWVIGRGRGAAPAGLFHGGRLAIIRLTKPVGNGDSVAVTVERSGGTAKPTHAPILTAPPGSA
jgi:anti-sigma-K factor RskA